MGKIFDLTLDVLKTGGYFTVGGICFYLLNGGKLPFQTMGNVQRGSALGKMKREHNAMTSNSKDDKNEKNVNKDTNKETTNGKPSAGNQTSDKKTNETNETNSTKNPDSNLNQTETESEFRQRLSEESICGGIMGEITAECVTKMKNIEEKKKKGGSK